MDPNGNADPRNGIREFVVGTGGEALDTLASDPGSGTSYADPQTVQAAADKWYGVMKLTLGRGWYKWDYESAMEDPAFVPAGATPTTYSDTGSGLCNGRGGIGSDG